jgi:hypothetical protein
MTVMSLFSANYFEIAKPIPLADPVITAIFSLSDTLLIYSSIITIDRAIDINISKSFN